MKLHPEEKTRLTAEFAGISRDPHQSTRPKFDPVAVLGRVDSYLANVAAHARTGNFGVARPFYSLATEGIKNLARHHQEVRITGATREGFGAAVKQMHDLEKRYGVSLQTGGSSIK